MQKGDVLVAFLCVFLLTACQPQFNSDYKIREVVDGDTLVLSGDGSTKIDLAFIDAPEIEQPFGRDARRGLEQLTQKGSITLEYISDGKALVYVDNKPVNDKMVQQGYAWVDAPVSADTQIHSRLKALENQAKLLDAGLWGQDGALIVPPWQWRADGREVNKGQAHRIRLEQQLALQRRQQALRIQAQQAQKQTRRSSGHPESTDKKDN